jgi:hypothetical protein
VETNKQKEERRGKPKPGEQKACHNISRVIMVIGIAPPFSFLLGGFHCLFFPMPLLF